MPSSSMNIKWNDDIKMILPMAEILVQAWGILKKDDMLSSTPTRANWFTFTACQRELLIKDNLMQMGMYIFNLLFTLKGGDRIQ